MDLTNLQIFNLCKIYIDMYMVGEIDIKQNRHLHQIQHISYCKDLYKIKNFQKVKEKRRRKITLIMMVPIDIQKQIMQYSEEQNNYNELIGIRKKSRHIAAAIINSQSIKKNPIFRVDKKDGQQQNTVGDQSFRNKLHNNISKNKNNKALKSKIIHKQSNNHYPTKHSNNNNNTTTTNKHIRLIKQSSPTLEVINTIQNQQQQNQHQQQSSSQRLLKQSNNNIGNRQLLISQTNQSNSSSYVDQGQQKIIQLNKSNQSGNGPNSKKNQTPSNQIVVFHNKKILKKQQHQFTQQKYQQRFQCKCGRFFSSLRIFRIHVTQYHNKHQKIQGDFLQFMIYPTQDCQHYPQDKYRCVLCKNCYYSRFVLAEHVKNVHKNNNKQSLNQTNEKDHKQQQKLQQQSQQILQEQNSQEENVSVDSLTGEYQKRTQHNTKNIQQKRILTQRQEQQQQQQNKQVIKHHNQYQLQKQNKSILLKKSSKKQDKSIPIKNTSNLNHHQYEQKIVSEMKVVRIKNNFNLTGEQKKLYDKLSLKKKNNNKKQQNIQTINETFLQDKIKLQQPSGIPAFIYDSTTTTTQQQQQQTRQNQHEQNKQLNWMIKKMQRHMQREKMNHILFEKKVAYLKRLEEEVKVCKEQLAQYLQFVMKSGTKKQQIK